MMGSDTDQNDLSQKRGGPHGRIKRQQRRRVFSCESCQRRKCKCLFDTALRSCRQCHSLRLACSLRDSLHLISSAVPDADSLPAAQLQKMEAMEQKLQRHEEAIDRLQDQLRQVSSQVSTATHDRQRLHRTPLPPHPPRRSPLWSPPPPAHTSLPLQPNPEDLSAAADEMAGSAPVVVLREIDKHLDIGWTRRKMGTRSTDVVSMGIIDEDIASDLVYLFHLRHGLAQFVCGIDQHTPSRQLRELYPFLHSVFCLLGLYYRPNLVSSPAHFKINKHVRRTLGEALLASPLPMDAIYAMLLVSEEVTEPFEDSSNYIDSWLLTGYCAQQAMLGVNFAAIVSRIKHGTSTAADQSAIRLWVTICLGHLRWSVMTGRQPVIPSAYLNHCSMLVSFYDASSDDGMLLSEVMLFSALWQTPADPRQRGSVVLTEWKDKWNHLLQLPTSAKLWLSYRTACLISTVRSLECLGENLLSETFLSPSSRTHSSYVEIEDTDDDDDDDDDDNNDETASELEGSQNIPAAAAVSKARLRQEVCHEAVSIVQHFLLHRVSFAHTLRLSDWLCLAYSALILGHYGEQELEREKDLADQTNQANQAHRRYGIHSCLECIIQLEESCRKPVGSMRVLRHAVRMAKCRLQARLDLQQQGPASRHDAPASPQPLPPHCPPANIARPDPQATLLSSSSGPSTMDRSPAQQVLQLQEREERDYGSFLALEDHTDVFFNMNGFFSGGFLDFSYRDDMGQASQ